MLRLIDVSKTYLSADTRVTVLNEVSLNVARGESISIEGPSGCGKSTLLHLIGALDKPDSGEVIFSVQDSSQQNSTLALHNFTEKQADRYRRQHIGIVFQKFNLIDCISVYENISLPGRLNNHLNHPYITELIERLNIAQHMHKLPTQLSGGEQQRVAIARALAHKPQLVLADEPTGNLDEENSAMVARLLFETCQALNTTLIVVTHSPSVAQMASKQLHMHNKQLTEHVL